jgi:hypothetical protein
VHLQDRDEPLVHYRDRSVQVTSEAIHVDGEVYRFDQLSRVWHRRGQRSWKALAGRGAWGLTYLAPFAAAVLGFAIAAALEVSLAARATIVVAAILAGLSAGPLLDPILGRMDDSFDRGLHQHEIWVERNGVELRILQVRDASRFGRIYRAVERAAGT